MAGNKKKTETKVSTSAATDSAKITAPVIINHTLNGLPEFDVSVFDVNDQYKEYLVLIKKKLRNTEKKIRELAGKSNNDSPVVLSDIPAEKIQRYNDFLQILDTWKEAASIIIKIRNNYEANSKVYVDFELALKLMEDLKQLLIHREKIPHFNWVSKKCLSREELEKLVSFADKIGLCGDSTFKFESIEDLFKFFAESNTTTESCPLTVAETFRLMKKLPKTMPYLEKKSLPQKTASTQPKTEQPKTQTKKAKTTEQATGLTVDTSKKQDLPAETQADSVALSQGPVVSQEQQVPVPASEKVTAKAKQTNVEQIEQQMDEMTLEENKNFSAQSDETKKSQARRGRNMNQRYRGNSRGGGNARHFNNSRDGQAAPVEGTEGAVQTEEGQHQFSNRPYRGRGAPRGEYRGQRGGPSTGRGSFSNNREGGRGQRFNPSHAGNSSGQKPTQTNQQYRTDENQTSAEEKYLSTKPQSTVDYSKSSDVTQVEEKAIDSLKNNSSKNISVSVSKSGSYDKKSHVEIVNHNLSTKSALTNKNSSSQREPQTVIPTEHLDNDGHKHYQQQQPNDNVNMTNNLFSRKRVNNSLEQIESISNQTSNRGPSHANIKNKLMDPYTDYSPITHSVNVSSIGGGQKRTPTIVKHTAVSTGESLNPTGHRSIAISTKTNDYNVGSISSVPLRPLQNYRMHDNVNSLEDSSENPFSHSQNNYRMNTDIKQEFFNEKKYDIFKTGSSSTGGAVPANKLSQNSENHQSQRIVNKYAENPFSRVLSTGKNIKQKDSADIKNYYPYMNDSKVNRGRDFSGNQKMAQPISSKVKGHNQSSTFANTAFIDDKSYVGNFDEHGNYMQPYKGNSVMTSSYIEDDQKILNHESLTYADSDSENKKPGPYRPPKLNYSLISNVKTNEQNFKAPYLSSNRNQNIADSGDYYQKQQFNYDKNRLFANNTNMNHIYNDNSVSASNERVHLDSRSPSSPQPPQFTKKYKQAHDIDIDNKRQIKKVMMEKYEYQQQQSHLQYQKQNQQHLQKRASYPNEQDRNGYESVAVTLDNRVIRDEEPEQVRNTMNYVKKDDQSYSRTDNNLNYRNQYNKKHISYAVAATTTTNTQVTQSAVYSDTVRDFSSGNSKGIKSTERVGQDVSKPVVENVQKASSVSSNRTNERVQTNTVSKVDNKIIESSQVRKQVKPTTFKRFDEPTKPYTEESLANPVIDSNVNRVEDTAGNSDKVDAQKHSNVKKFKNNYVRPMQPLIIKTSSLEENVQILTFNRPVAVKNYDKTNSGEALENNNRIFEKQANTAAKSDRKYDKENRDFKDGSYNYAEKHNTSNYVNKNYANKNYSNNYTDRRENRPAVRNNQYNNGKTIRVDQSQTKPKPVIKEIAPTANSNVELPSTSQNLIGKSGGFVLNFDSVRLTPTQNFEEFLQTSDEDDDVRNRKTKKHTNNYNKKQSTRNYHTTNNSAKLGLNGYTSKKPLSTKNAVN